MKKMMKKNTTKTKVKKTMSDQAVAEVQKTPEVKETVAKYSRDYDLLARVTKMIGAKAKDFAFDFKGHHEPDLKRFSSDITMSFYLMEDEELAVLDTGAKLDKPVHFNLMGVNQCYYCGEYMKVTFDGETLYSSTECEFPGGIKEMNVDLRIPSGKMVFANDLREWFPCHSDFNVNTQAGIYKTTRAYEKVGMAHGFVSNTCPGVHQVDKRTLSISGSGGEEGEETWHDDFNDYAPLSKEEAIAVTAPGKEVGGICTDLWWYSVVDYKDFERRFVDLGGTLEEFKAYIKDRCDIVKVDKGIYTFTHFFDVDGGWDEPKKQQRAPTHYALINWTKELDKLVPYEEYKKINYTIGQCWLASLAEYPSIFGLDRDDESLPMEALLKKLATYSEDQIENSFAMFLDRTFGTFDRGSWHPNGWGCGRPIPEGIPDDYPVPPMTKKHRWENMRKEYCGLYLAGTGEESYLGSKIYTLNESFLAAAYDMCYAVLTYGSEEYRNDSEEQRLKIEKSRRKVVLASVKKLNQRFPGTLPERLKEFI